MAAANDPKSKMSTAYRKKLLAATDYIEAAGPVVRWPGDAPVTMSTSSDIATPLTATIRERWQELAGAATSSAGCRRRSTNSSLH